MNATTVSGIKLKVSISRNQPIEFGDKGINSWNAIGKSFINNFKFFNQYFEYSTLSCIMYIIHFYLSTISDN